MSIYLGTFGKVELRRQFEDTKIVGTIAAGDVNTTRKRFSFDFEKGQLVTGDQVTIRSTSGAALSFISGYTRSSTKRFINVDAIGGIRLYNSFADAVNGGATNAVALATPSSSIPVNVTVENSDFRVVAQVNSFELNTQRETVDTTTLSDDFRSQISSLMSGSGRMSCFWEYTGETVQDIPQYILQLILRTKVGSKFGARFYLKSGNHNPSGIAANANDEIWYEFNGVLTSCAMQFSPDSAVQFTADFITTGTIELKTELETTDQLLQESSDDILLEQDATAKLSLESSDI
tara:strand:+ start:329 stop:1201 length:873 start_codon:yes stop_codon:yes gene_type:complete